MTKRITSNPKTYFSDTSGSPSKSLGQNFLKDKNIINKILNTAKLSEHDRVLEIGPGLGALTEQLAKLTANLTVVEKDKKMLPRLAELSEVFGNIEVVSEDCLNVDFKSLFNKVGVKVVSNLPYSVSTPILLKLLESRELFSSLVLMLQLEVGERIASPPGSKKYGSISVLLQTYFDITLEFKVPPTAFWPKPKVYSVVLKLIPLKTPRVEVQDEKHYEKVIRAAFSSRRKMLGNSLSSVFTKDRVLKALQLSGIDPKRRAETLSIEEFGRLADNL